MGGTGGGAAANVGLAGGERYGIANWIDRRWVRVDAREELDDEDEEE